MRHEKNENPLQTFVETFGQLPQHILKNMVSRYRSFLFRFTLHMHRSTINIPPDIFHSMKKELTARRSKAVLKPTALSSEETGILHRIREQVESDNRNNMTRARAYLQIYLQHPELHWAFLAHMVTRNGGWNMTDLQGELLPHLLDLRTRQRFFGFLERCNALIFHDAYPQLLLYEESIKRHTDLFHLLPIFHISKFMHPFWKDFWVRKDPRLLTVALIVNEQNYIEKRVVQNAPFENHVLDTLPFKAQSLLHVTQVVFPYLPPRQKFASTAYRLAGLNLENFSNLEERIEFGKSLYGILFGIREVYEGALHFAKTLPHTASRADYWPEIFCRTKESNRENYAAERLAAGKLIQGSPKFYSPELQQAWKDRPVEPPDRFDWFQDDTPYAHFTKIKAPFFYDMTDNFSLLLNKLEMAVMALDKKY